MATKSYFLKNVAASGSNFGSLQEGTSPTISAAATVHGWAVAKLAPSRWSIMDFGVEQASGTFGTSDLLVSPLALDNTTGNAWRTENPLTGVFANTTWTFNLTFRPSVVSVSGRPKVQFWRSTNANGSNATFIASSGTIASAQTQSVTTTTYTYTFNQGLLDRVFNNEYLFVIVEWEITTAGTSNTSATRWYIPGTAATAAIVTADFSPYLPVNFSATQTTDLPTQSATGIIPVWPRAFAADQATALPTQTATATAPIAGTGAQATALPTQTATGKVLPVGGAWTPLNLAGCKALYTAKDAASVGATWLDQTSNHYDLTPVSPGSLTYDANAFGTGEAGVVLDGVDDMFRSPLVTTNTDKIWAFFRVYFNVQTNNTGRHVSLPLPGGFNDFGQEACCLFQAIGNPPFDRMRTTRDAASMGTSLDDPDTVVVGVSRIFGTVFDGANNTFYLRDVAKEAVASTGLFGPTNYIVMGSANPNTYTAYATQFSVMALAFGVGDLSQADITNIVGWLDNPVMGAVAPTAINITGAQTTPLPTQAATAKALVSVIAGDVSAWPPAGATVHVDFLRGGWVQGVGNVNINTLIGADPNWSGSGYYPDAITAYGYDWYGLGKSDSPCGIGALRTAVLRGDSTIIKLQTGVGEFQEWIEFSLNPATKAYAFNIYNTGDDATGYGSLFFDTPGLSVMLGNVWQKQTGPNIVNVVGFNIVNSNRIDLAANDRDAGTQAITDTQTPPGDPLAVVNLLGYGPIASITTYPTLSLAALRAKTAQVLVQPPSQATALPVQTATAVLTLAGNLAADQTTALPAQTATASIPALPAGISLTATQTTALPTQVSTAAARVAAGATQTTAPAVQVATGTARVTASAAHTSALPTQVATAAARAAAQATQSTAFPTQVATATAPIAGTATQATALPTQAALASLPLSGLNYAALQATDLPVQTATGRAIVTASPAQVTPLPAQTTAVTLRVVASAGQTTALPVQAAVASARTSGTATQTTPLPVQAATARARVSASSAQVLAFPTQVAAATIGSANHLFVNHNGVWKPATTYVNHAGTWKRPAHIFVNDAGVWKEVA